MKLPSDKKVLLSYIVSVGTVFIFTLCVLTTTLQDVDERGIREQMESHGTRQARSIAKNRPPIRDKIYMNNINKRFSVFEKKLRAQKEVLKSVQEILEGLRD